MTGCSKEDIKRLGQLINSLLEKVGIKHDDQSDKIEMLRKIELRLNFLCAARDYIYNSNQKKELEEKEKELHVKRKEENIKKKKAREQRFADERARKN